MLNLKCDRRENIPAFQYKIFRPIVDCKNIENIINGPYKFRKPNGLEYKGSPILLFGCSFAQGYTLKDNQTFSYKLSHLLKKTVYNRAISSCGLQHMYMQTLSDQLYKDVPKPETILYLFIGDQFRRIFIRNFHIANPNYILTYSVKNNKLIEDEYNNILKNIFYASYTVKLFNAHSVKNLLYKEKYNDYVTNMALLYFVESRKALFERYNYEKDLEPNFIVILYPESNSYKRLKNILKQKLLKNNFTVIDVADLTAEDFYSKKYDLPNRHPSEEAWNLLTPLLAPYCK